MSHQPCLLVVLMVAAAQFDLSWAQNRAIPDYIQICKRSDPHVEDCIINSIEKLRPNLKQGIPEMGVPALEPLSLPEVVVSQMPGFKASGSNLLVHGASDFKIKYLKANVSDNYAIFDTEINIPQLKIDGQYQVNGKILMVPVNGKGPMNVNASGIDASAHMVGLVKDGKGHFKSMDIKIKKMKNFRVHFDGLFSGDRNLGQALNGALNENRNQMSKVMGPMIEKVIGDILLETSNKIVEAFDYNAIFPK